MDNKRKANIPANGQGTPKTKRFKYYLYDYFLIIKNMKKFD
jgi:hypothetical protein